MFLFWNRVVGSHAGEGIFTSEDLASPLVSACARWPNPIPRIYEPARLRLSWQWGL